MEHDPVFKTLADLRKWERRERFMAKMSAFFGIPALADWVEYKIATVRAAHAHLIKDSDASDA